jgi:LuxR family glucitol operon transcriptional activator
MEIEKNYQKVLDKLSDPNCDLSQYCFDELVHDIANMYPMAYKLLVTLSVSPFGLTRENLFCLTKVSDSQLDEADDALNMLNRCSLVFHSDGYNRMLPITRKYALSKLEENSVLELEVRNSWVNCYLEIARTNGGEDFGEWHIRYDVINNEWKNFKEVFLWCQNHQKYPEASSLWKSLARFAYLYGYWTDRLEWTYWLTDNAFQRGDNAFLAELRSAWAWIALLREGSENLMKAEELLKSAWMLNKYCDPYIQNMIAINKAVLYTRKSDFLKADYWFGQYMELRKKNRNDLSQLHRDRLELRYLLYMGERYYRGGNYDRAKRLYKQVTKKSEGILWLRIKVKAFERIAYIAIKENRLEDAKELLDDWYLVTKRNNEFRRMAYFERDYAELEFKNENYDKAKEWANKALGKFLSLNMLNRVDAMKKFISKCNSHLK